MKKHQKYSIALAAALLFQALLPSAGFAQADDRANSAQTAQATKVKIEDFDFSPATITVKSGSTVTWTNQDSAIHNVQMTGLNLPQAAQKIEFPNPPETIDLKQGKSASITFTKPGTYTYICTYHPHMQGVVIVQ